MAETATTSLKLDAAMKQRLHRLADSRQRSSHWLMKQAIEQYVDREEKREQLRQDILTAWEEYQETGLHLTGAEADAWLEKLAAGEDAEIPACHI
jgi:predicted transcriptional regulator